ncbi:MAG: GNAT family N-acetyltransferase [Bacteroidales bacterium]|nr:GNAT family N-acetyltransferase [Bacteroidales bacterium]
MRFIDAYWEQRNLGLKVCELIFDKNETIDDYELNRKISDFDYIVAKIHKDNIRLIHELEGLDFRYLENQLSLVINVKMIEKIDKKWESRYKKIDCVLLNEKSDLQDIIRKTEEGLFGNDRFSVDPEINDGGPNKRIANWITDISLRDNSKIYLLKSEEKILAFFVFKQLDEKSAFIEIAGIFKEYRTRGYSLLLLFHMLQASFDTGIKRLKADISTNNINALNFFSRFVNFKIRANYVVLRKINNTIKA